MKKTALIAAIATIAFATAYAPAAPAAEASQNKPVTQLHYGATGATDGVHGELLAAPAYGDLANGAHGTFIRMPAGFVSPIHVHSGDYWGVVVSGVAANGLPGSKNIELPAGSYWYQKGDEKHVTKCLSPNECLFFISQQSKFDYLPNVAAK